MYMYMFIYIYIHIYRDICRINFGKLVRLEDVLVIYFWTRRYLFRTGHRI